MSTHVKLLLENVQKPSCTPLGNPAEAETHRGNFDIKVRLSEKRQESSSFMERRKSMCDDFDRLILEPNFLSRADFMTAFGADFPAYIH